MNITLAVAREVGRLLCLARIVDPIPVAEVRELPREAFDTFFNAFDETEVLK